MDGDQEKGNHDDNNGDIGYENCYIILYFLILIKHLILLYEKGCGYSLVIFKTEQGLYIKLKFFVNISPLLASNNAQTKLNMFLCGSIASLEQ